MSQDNYSFEQIKKAIDAVDIIKRRKIKDVNFYLRNTLTRKEITLAYYLLTFSDGLFSKKEEKESVKLEWQKMTPYTILGIEEKEYTNKELLEAMSKKIKLIQNYYVDKEQINEEIDVILDAYNQLTKTYSKKR